MTEEYKEKKRRRGIYLLPNLFTTAGLFAGFYSIVAAMTGRFEAAAIAIFFAMIMDGLDGRIARLTNTQSDFGTEYDSLSDMVAFGLAPALIMYKWSLYSLGKPGWLAAFIFTASAALRLARFNTQVSTVDKAYFQGLASPPAAALLAGFIWVGSDYEVHGGSIAWFTFLMTIVAGVLMVSNVRYKSFKDIDLRNRVPFVAILLVVLIYVFISLDPPRVLFAMAATYALSGPVMMLIEIKRRRQSRIEGQSEEQTTDEQTSSENRETTENRPPADE